MKKLLVTGLMTVLAGLCFSVVFSQTAAIKVEAISHRDVADFGLPTTSSGLKTVGQGELVYLSGWDAGGDTVLVYTWSLESIPAGSHAVLDSTDKKRTTFIPDTTGHFVVKLEVTTAAGSHDTTVTITSAHYVGVGGIAGLGTDVTIGQCGLCHADKRAEWAETGHATMLERGITGVLSDHYGPNCIECHTVGYNSFPTAINGGFDDVAKNLGWTFPAYLVPANWDTLVHDFSQLAQKANIQCENCHGPGSLHKGNKDFIDMSLDVGMCARCHDSGTYHIRPLQWRNSGHSKAVSEHAATNETCGGCHSSYGFVKRVSPTGDPDQKGTGLGEITCAACHDPHSVENEHQVRTVADVTLGNGEVISSGSLGKLCMNCHKSRRDAETYAEDYHSHYGPHLGPQTDMLFGTNAITFGLHIPSSTHYKVIDETCVTCHMAATPAAGEPGQNKIGEHSFAMAWTDETTNQEIQNVSACTQCHGTVASFDDFMAKADYDKDGTIESAQDEILGLLDEVGTLLPPVGDPEVVVTNAYTKVQLKAAYNYKFVKEDRSEGVHNYQYALNLLRVSHAALTTGDLGAGSINQIADVPGDQGKQVRVAWSRFGGDGVAEMPIEYYALWRKVAMMGKKSLQKSVPVYESMEQIVQAKPAELEKGARVMVGNDLWDYIKMVPAAGFDEYSTVVPTLFDSTASAGIQWSVFVITGHTSDPAIYAVTEPDSGYSIDNLAPAAPANLSVKETAEGAVLSWDEAADEDFNYFAIYRGTNSGFDPSATEPIKTTTQPEFLDVDVSVNATYFYRIASFDFAGNQGELSNEISVFVTKVNGSILAAIPDEFILSQNFPNPFNPSTEITFGLPKEEYVTVVVYNVLGVKIRTLAEGNFGAGYHKFVWDAKNEFGDAVAPGMYIYRLKSASRTLTQKMILLK